MTQIQVGCTLRYEVHQPTIFLLKIAAAKNSFQAISNEVLTFEPNLDVEQCQVGEDGNRLHRIVVQPCNLTVRYDATATMNPGLEYARDVGETDIAEIPPAILTYLNPSRYCESDLLARFAFDEFGQLERGYLRVQAISDWVFRHLYYEPGSTHTSTTASDVLVQRTGVCRDYAHLAISLCRGVGIPARYVSGYAVDLTPPDFHGFMEAYLGGHWYLFDPTRLASTRGLVRIGIGRDAADVAFSTLNGLAMLTEQQVWAYFSDSIPGLSPDPAVSIA